MRSVRRKGTRPEMVVRRAAYSLGLRYRLHQKNLPGTPDLVFPGRRAVILVHGCFWHRHPNCSRATTPSSNAEFWQNKFDANVKRDKRKAAQLAELGWRVITIWECETSDEVALRLRLRKELILTRDT